MPEPSGSPPRSWPTWRALMVMIQRVHEHRSRQLQRDSKMTQASYQVLVVPDTYVRRRQA